MGGGRDQSSAYEADADAERTKQTRAKPLPFIQQAKQQVRRAYALFSLALHLFTCQEDYLFGAGGE